MSDVDGTPLIGKPAEDLTGRQHITKALAAAMWTYGGRGTGLLWTVTLIAQIGVGGYGQYAMAFAIGAIVSAPIDNPFAVRSIRESEERFRAERSLRVIIAVSMIVLGIILYPVSYLLWFGLVASGGEMVFAAYKSRRHRDGHPDKVQRMDTTRQVSAVILGGGYLYLVPDPTLAIASILYAIPYLVVALMAIRVVWGDRPAFPGPIKMAAVLFGENLATALYLQGDVLLLGFLTDSTVAGYYSVAVVCAWAVAQVGAALGGTYHEKLRDGAGTLSSGPPLKHTVSLAGAAALLLLLAGIVMEILPLATELATSVIIMSAFVFFRVINYVYTTILSIQRRDVVRSGAAAVVVPIKLGLVTLFVSIGAVGAAISSVIADGILLAIYFYVLNRPPRALQNVPHAKHRMPDNS
ncbi:hypothetical protein [Williamsia sp.]|uniref:lipopolysaccharide biosynthesis protein n=1 Tax=Williamsia sp. TaxID=1872085 RepID=UPI001A34C99D|nr:hypothetical protein [Williamsia sp.]MBJ7289139.1 hypothetical protein [Williamsia sp.]